MSNATAPTRDPRQLILCIKGAGEMASGIAWCLHRAGFTRIFMVEIRNPLAVRRRVSFCEAVRLGEQNVEGITAVRAVTEEEVFQAFGRGQIPVIPDPDWEFIPRLGPDVVIDALIAKRNLGTRRDEAPLVLGLGPGFTAGEDVDQVIETHRGHDLGRIIEQGKALPNTGIPGNIGGFTSERVLRAPCNGTFESLLDIGDAVEAGRPVGRVNGSTIIARISGVLRGQIQPGTPVKAGLKLGDIDPRGDAEFCATISDKARTLGGAVIQAVDAWARQRHAGLLQALDLPPGAVISLMGGGGKTTLMFTLAREAAAQGKKVLTTTSTRIFLPTPEQSPALVLAENSEVFEREALPRLKLHTHITLGAWVEEDKGKLKGPPPAFIDDIAATGRFDLIIVEADGARQFPIKASAAHGPVLPHATTHLIHVTGLDSLDQSLDSDHVHRPEILARNLDLDIGQHLTPDHLARNADFELTKAQAIVGPASCTALLNKADLPGGYAGAREVAARLRGPATKCLVTSLNQSSPLRDVFLSSPEALAQ